MITSIVHRGDPAGRRTAMRKTRAMLAALAAAAVLAATGGTVALASTGSAAATDVPRCREGGGLVTGLYGYEQGYYDGNGQGGFILTLTNTSGTACYLYGYPGLGLEDANHHVLPSDTHWGSTYFAKDPGRHKVVLSPGETASASVAFVYTGTNKAHATYLEVTPPNAYDHASIEIPNNVGQISTHDLYVTAMARHTPWKGSDHVCCLAGTNEG
jgi:Protein of unknown function (DUF4232)